MKISDNKKMWLVIGLILLVGGLFFVFFTWLMITLEWRLLLIIVGVFMSNDCGGEEKMFSSERGRKKQMCRGQRTRLFCCAERRALLGNAQLCPERGYKDQNTN